MTGGWEAITALSEPAGRYLPVVAAGAHAVSAVRTTRRAGRNLFIRQEISERRPPHGGGRRFLVKSGLRWLSSGFSGSDQGDEVQRQHQIEMDERLEARARRHRIVRSQLAHDLERGRDVEI